MLNMLIGITWGILTAHADSTVTETARLRWMEGDARGVISTIEPWLDTRTGPYGNERDALRLLLAKAYAEQGRELIMEYFDEPFPIRVEAVGCKGLYDPDNLLPRG